VYLLDVAVEDEDVVEGVEGEAVEEEVAVVVGNK